MLKNFVVYLLMCTSLFVNVPGSFSYTLGFDNNTYIEKNLYNKTSKTDEKNESIIKKSLPTGKNKIGNRSVWSIALFSIVVGGLAVSYFLSKSDVENTDIKNALTKPYTNIDSNFLDKTGKKYMENCQKKAVPIVDTCTNDSKIVEEKEVFTWLTAIFEKISECFRTAKDTIANKINGVALNLNKNIYTVANLVEEADFVKRSCEVGIKIKDYFFEILYICTMLYLVVSVGFRLVLPFIFSPSTFYHRLVETKNEAGVSSLVDTIFNPTNWFDLDLWKDLYRDF